MSPASAADFGVPTRDEGALLWVSERVDPERLAASGWDVRSFRELRDDMILPAQAIGSERENLTNPAERILDLVGDAQALAVVGVSLRTPADLRDLYGYVIEPAFRRGTILLVSSDREIADLKPHDFIDSIGFPWTLERLQYIEERFRLGAGPDKQPPMTPIETRLWMAMQDIGLAPVAQYGIGPYRADFAFPEVRLVVECDGRRWHDPERDAQRDAHLRKLGWEPLHFTGSEIHHDAPACAQGVRQLVDDRGYTARSDQPAVSLPPRPAASRTGWWSRFVTWLCALLRLGGGSVDEGAPAGAEASVTRAPTRVPGAAGAMDDEQTEAVLSQDGVTQVIAPAGSGKTTVLIARVRELVSRGVAPNRIICCTFNSAAAKDLGSRLNSVGIDGVETRTFHGLGRAILDEADQLRDKHGTATYAMWRFLAKHAQDATEDGVWIDAPDAKDGISDLKLGRMLSPAEFCAEARTPRERTLAEVYRLYEKHQEEADQNDFDDQIYLAVRLMQEEPAVRIQWQQKFDAVLVDEYQDIEPAQELLVRTVAAPEDLLFGVGDEDQCIYAWRRASVERIVELDLLYPGLERHALARNYRCPIDVVEASRALIGHNRRRFPKDIQPARSDHGEITLVAARDLDAQGAHAARLVKDQAAGQAVVLARTTAVLRAMALGLAQAGVSFDGPERLKKNSGEQDVLLSYVRLLGAPHLAQPSDVETVFRVPNRHLPQEKADNVASGLRKGLTFAQAISRARVEETFRQRRLADATALFDRLKGIADAMELVQALRTQGGLDRHYADAEQLNPTDRSSIDALALAESKAAGLSVLEFAEVLDYEASVIEGHLDPGAGVELRTIHQAKGRQWPLVIVGGFDDGVLPHLRSLLDEADPEGELESERRLAYVAMTRTSDRLVLMSSRTEPSRFVGEAAVAAAARTVVLEAEDASLKRPSPVFRREDHGTDEPHVGPRPQRPRSGPTGGGAGASAAPKRAGRPWTLEEDSRLASEWADGDTVATIAGTHARTQGAITSRLVKFGFVTSTDEALARG